MEQKYLDAIDTDNISKMTKYCEDFLKHNFGDEKYDNIIMNPPYIRIQELGTDYVKFIKEMFPIIKRGNIDIYQAFILKSISLLKDGGKFVSIHPNSILYNKSSKQLMKYLIENRYITEIIDYKSEKVFESINVYCCIMVFNKNPNKKWLIYNSKRIEYKNIVDSIFDTSTNCEKLSKYIKPFCGIATLCDKVFIHDSKMYNEPCWKPIFKVSKNIIRFIIFPYDNECNILEENEFKRLNPKTYNYLIENREILSKRDKGKKTYEKWYAFGRKQGIKMLNSKNVIYIPTMGEKHFPIYQKPFTLFYSGICVNSIDSNSSISMETIASILNKEKSRNYIFENSSKRGSDWINISSTTLSNVPF